MKHSSTAETKNFQVINRWLLLTTYYSEETKNYLLTSNLKVKDTIHKIKKPESTFQSYTGENREKEEAEKVRHDLLWCIFFQNKKKKEKKKMKKDRRCYKHFHLWFQQKYNYLNNDNNYNCYCNKKKNSCIFCMS